MYILAILYDVAAAYYAWDPNSTVNYQFGHHIAQGVARIVMLIDKTASLSLISTTKPWFTAV
jgi:hypothetical protein